MTVQLYLKIDELGYEFVYGNAQRSDEQAEINAIKLSGRERVAQLIGAEFPELATKLRNNGKNSGVRFSTHLLCLAVDINLFKDGVYLDKTEDHTPLGEFWESIGGTWGGRFKDGNHYSLEHNGVK